MIETADSSVLAQVCARGAGKGGNGAGREAEGGRATLTDAAAAVDGAFGGWFCVHMALCVSSFVLKNTVCVALTTTFIHV